MGAGWAHGEEGNAALLMLGKSEEFEKCEGEGSESHSGTSGYGDLIFSDKVLCDGCAACPSDEMVESVIERYQSVLDDCDTFARTGEKASAYASVGEALKKGFASRHDGVDEDTWESLWRWRHGVERSTVGYDCNH